jgi:hypothetical protein
MASPAHTINPNVCDMRGKFSGILRVPDDAQPERRASKPSQPWLGAAAYWPCVCECGREIVARGSALRRLQTISCGADECQVRALQRCGRPLPRVLALLRPPLGQVFGRLTVMGLGNRRDSNNRRYWIFRCECGTVKEQVASKVVAGNIVSCGCLTADAVRAANTKYADPKQKHRNSLLSNYKRHALARGFPFEISDGEFSALTKQPCKYCGRTEVSTESLRYGGDLAYNGVDRIDSSLGYVPENCAPCCKTCNVMKQRLTVDEFIGHLRMVLSHIDGEV